MSNPRAALPVNLARLPPLTSLRAFVVTARHLNFADAARELHVTPAAIGQQVRLLEDYLQTPLFARRRGALEPTEAASALLPNLQEGFERLLMAFSDLSDTPSDEPVRIAVTPSFAAKWLVPRLDRIREALPTLRLSIEASTDLADLTGAQVDCAIRYGRGIYPRLQSDRLFGEAVVPVCTPDVARRWRLGGADDVALLHEDGPEQDAECPSWSHWLATYVMPSRDPHQTVRLGSPSLVLDAALAGHGIALGKLRLAEADIAAGRLVVPFGTAREVGHAYYFVASPLLRRDPRVDAFRQWVLGEAETMRGLAQSCGESGRQMLSVLV